MVSLHEVYCTRKISMADKPLEFCFCSQCGFKCSKRDKFCSSCGFSLSSPATEKPKSTISLEEFCKRKEEHHSSYFLPKSKKKKTQVRRVENVTITIGIMRLCEKATLKKIRGSNMALAIAASSNESTLLEHAIAKHARFNKAFNGDLKYTLLYPDGSEVKSTLPGSNEPFSLERYKDELGKPYSRITLLICRVTDFCASTLHKMTDFDESSDSDEQDHATNISEVVVSDVGMSHLPQEPSTSASCSSSCLTVDNDDIENSEVNLLGSSETSLVRVECPTCFDYFEINEIAHHADCCADIWIGEVDLEHCNDLENVSDNPDEEQQISELQQLQEETEQQTFEENIKSILAGLAERELSSQVRVNIRRTLMWNDFKGARMKNRIKPNNMVKVAFTGESAIDDGGPRREFFSGNMLIFLH